MAKKSKRYLIATETHEILILRNGREKGYGFCAVCEGQVELLNLDAAVAYAGKTTREIFSLIETEKVHSLETTTGLLLVCRNSLQGAKT